MPRRIYTDEFRQGCVNLLLSSGRGLKRVVAELGLSSNALRDWRERALSQGRGAQAASPQAKGRPWLMRRRNRPKGDSLPQAAP